MIRANAPRTLALVALATAMAGPALGNPAVEPRQMVQQTVSQVLFILGDHKLSLEERRQRVTDLAYAHFDFDTMAKLVLGRNWRRFDPAQQKEFQREFRVYLAHQYGDRIDRFDNQTIEVTGEREEVRGDVTVKTVIHGGEAEGADVDYRLRKSGGEWKVIDVVIEGISLVANYRDQFASVISGEGPDGLLRRLREKNAQGFAPAAANP